MSDGLNLVTLFGNLGADPELKNSEKGPVLKLRLATQHSWFDKEQNKREEKVEWHDLKMFGPRAESLSKHLRKGAKLLVQGRLSTYSYEKDGQKRYRTDVIVEDVFFGGGGRANGAFQSGFSPVPLSSTDLPF